MREHFEKIYQSENAEESRWAWNALLYKCLYNDLIEEQIGANMEILRRTDFDVFVDQIRQFEKYLEEHNLLKDIPCVPNDTSK